LEAGQRMLATRSRAIDFAMVVGLSWL
jgi:hypothetical protein